MPYLRGYYLRTNKPGEESDDCQDAVDFDPQLGVFAMSDGATQSLHARIFSNCLTKSYLAAHRAKEFTVASWLTQACDDWLRELQQQMAGGAGGELTRRGLERGKLGAATFLGVHYRNDEKGGLRVEAMAVGDTCCLHFSGDRLIRSFPLETAAEFSASPKCLFSAMTDEMPTFARTTLHLAVGDHLVLATDAFAKFLVRAASEDPQAIRRFLAIQSETNARKFIARWRAATGLKIENDDIAIASLILQESQVQDWSFPSPRLTAANPDLEPDADANASWREDVLPKLEGILAELQRVRAELPGKKLILSPPSPQFRRYMFFILFSVSLLSVALGVFHHFSHAEQTPSANGYELLDRSVSNLISTTKGLKEAQARLEDNLGKLTKVASSNTELSIQLWHLSSANAATLLVLSNQLATVTNKLSRLGIE